ncbi:DNA ligase [Streptomyces xanthophaeus]|nr:DNA ligase [Streptomyces xanthophaeus]
MRPRRGDAIDISEQRWRCVRGRSCQAVASVIYAAGRDQLDIEGLGGTRAVQLVEAGPVKDIADLFTLTREQLLGLEWIGETSAANLLAAIETARGAALSRVFCALGVRGIGRTMSRRIAAHFGSMAAIRAADADTLAGVAGIGTEKARVIAAELVALAPLLDKLQAQQAGTQVTEPQKPTTDTGDGEDSAGGPLAGQAVVVTGWMTGALAALSRNEMNELIERAGGKPTT